MKHFTAFFLMIFSLPAVATGSIDFLEVDDNIVYFSTSGAKSAASPQCVVAEKANLWSLSLTTDSGRAMYSLILTAMAKGDEMGVAVSSAGNCAIVEGVESVQNVSLVVNNASSSSSSSNDATQSGINKNIIAIPNIMSYREALTCLYVSNMSETVSVDITFNLYNYDGTPLGSNFYSNTNGVGPLGSKTTVLPKTTAGFCPELGSNKFGHGQIKAELNTPGATEADIVAWAYLWNVRDQRRISEVTINSGKAYTVRR